MVVPDWGADELEFAKHMFWRTCRHPCESECGYHGRAQQGCQGWRLILCSAQFQRTPFT